MDFLTDCIRMLQMLILVEVNEDGMKEAKNIPNECRKARGVVMSKVKDALIIDQFQQINLWIFF